MELLFYFLLTFVVYTYLVYPVLIAVLAYTHPMEIQPKASENVPFVSIIIAVKNESGNIKKRLDNLINQSYSADKYEVIIVSDGSTDSTNNIISDYIANHSSDDSIPSLKHLIIDVSGGKPSALNIGIDASLGEIIVLTDARQQFNHDVIEVLVSNFQDKNVGAVSGELYFRENDESEVQLQMGMYWKYEKSIRRSESKYFSLVGATGAIYAIRRELYDPVKPEVLIDDVVIPMSIVLKGYRVVFDGRAIAYDIVSKDNSQEWKRKVRTIAGNWQLINLMPSLYNPFINPVFIQFLSHKVFRTLVPFCLPVLLVLSMVLEGLFFEICQIVQIIGYGFALLGYLNETSRRNSLVGFCYFFVVLNLAAISGFWLWVTGRCGDIWRPAYKNQL